MLLATVHIDTFLLNSIARDVSRLRGDDGRGSERGGYIPIPYLGHAGAGGGEHAVALDGLRAGHERLRRIQRC